VSKGRQFGERRLHDRFLVSVKDLLLVVNADGQPAFVKPAHRCPSELCLLAWVKSSSSLSARVLFGRRGTELREVFEERGLFQQSCR